MVRLMNDQPRSATMRVALENETFSDAFDAKQSSAFVYTEKLTLNVSAMVQKGYLSVKGCWL